MKLLTKKEWRRFIDNADSYHGPMTIGQLFCYEHGSHDSLLVTVDEDSVWQIIYNKYVDHNEGI